MNYLVDTNVISEPTKARPNDGVLNWLANANEDSVFMSVVTVTELRYGIERLPVGKRRSRLDTWLRQELIPRFEGRVLPVDLEIADVCGRLVARTESVGRQLEPRDAFLAATAEVHELALVTRNVSDFESIVRSIVTPWT